MAKLVIFIPTYNEAGNIQSLYERIKALGLDATILLLDDNSPDGTGQIMDRIAMRDSAVTVIHRTGKLGIGSAHRKGIQWALDHGYSHFLSLDADFTHSPEDIPRLLAEAEANDMVIASRYLQDDSLAGWNLVRKSLTRTAHVLTRLLLGLRHDSTGAFRLYRLDRLNPGFLDEVRSNGYGFFFESLYVISASGAKIAEVAVALPPRTYGSSKMDYREIYRSVSLLLRLGRERWLPISQKNQEMT